MHLLLNRLGRVIRRLREDHGFSVSDLATRADLSSRFVTEIQAGRGNISILRLASLAAALGTTASQLIAAAEDEAAAPRLIALLGVRGAGKTTIGAKLAANLGVEFLELDRLVESEAGLSLADLFATHGEEYFRRLEVAALQRLLAEQRSAVLATGGGIVDNRKLGLFSSNERRPCGCAPAPTHTGNESSGKVMPVRWPDVRRRRLSCGGCWRGGSRSIAGRAITSTPRATGSMEAFRSLLERLGPKRDANE